MALTLFALINHQSSTSFKLIPWGGNYTARRDAAVLLQSSFHEEISEALGRILSFLNYKYKFNNAKYKKLVIKILGGGGRLLYDYKYACCGTCSCVLHNDFSVYNVFNAW